MGIFLNKVAPQSTETHTQIAFNRQLSQPQNNRGLCRICWECDGKLISPCTCAGSVEKVHENCMISWIEAMSKRNQGNPLRCQVCLEAIRYKYSMKLKFQPQKCLQKVHTISFCYLAILFTCILAITILSIMLRYGENSTLQGVGTSIIIGLLSVSSCCLLLITTLIIKLLLTQQIRTITKVLDRKEKSQENRSEERSSSRESSFSGSHSS